MVINDKNELQKIPTHLPTHLLAYSGISRMKALNKLLR